MSRRDRDPLISLRTLVIFTLAALVAAGAGVLTFASDRQVAPAVLVAGGAFAAACLFLHQIVQ